MPEPGKFFSCENGADLSVRPLGHRQRTICLIATPRLSPRPDPRFVCGVLPAKQLLGEVIDSIRNVIAPAIAEPYPKSQAYMAAVILEFVARQVEERSDIAAAKERVYAALFEDLAAMPALGEIARGGDPDKRLCEVIEQLHAERKRIGEATFTAVNDRIRRALRALLDEDLKVAGAKQD